MNDKRIIDLTVDEFIEVMRLTMQGVSSAEEAPQAPAKRYVYGIAGIASLFNCSATTANRIKSSGKIDAAISQCGRIITVDADLAVELFGKSQSKGE